MNTYEVVIRNYLKRGDTAIEYFSTQIEANSESEAEKLALESFCDAMSFLFKDEVIEIHSVNGVER